MIQYPHSIVHVHRQVDGYCQFIVAETPGHRPILIELYDTATARIDADDMIAPGGKQCGRRHVIAEAVATTGKRLAHPARRVEGKHPACCVGDPDPVQCRFHNQIGRLENFELRDKNRQSSPIARQTFDLAAVWSQDEHTAIRTRFQSHAREWRELAQVGH